MAEQLDPPRSGGSYVGKVYEAAKDNSGKIFIVVALVILALIAFG